MTRVVLVLVASLALGLVSPAEAQFGGLLDSAKRQANDAANKAAKGAVSGKPAQPAPAPGTAKSVETAATPAASPAVTGQTQPDAAQPAAAEVYGNDFDFVPGEKVIFFDDFSDADLGDSPIRWRGAGLVTIESQGRRWANTRPGNTCSGGQKLRLDVKDDMPKKFTLEFDAVFGETAYAFGREGSRNFAAGWAGVALGSSVVSNPPPAGVQHISISVNDTYAKIYVGGKRVHQNTDAVARPIKALVYCGWGKTQDSRPMITNVRIAEGGKDYGTELTTVGRIVTHGITFDSGSDVIRPESAPTLRNILKLLEGESTLRFEVQGHTDNQGGDKVNGPLSERRAAAVKAWLVKQGIEDARLTTKGLGATKPISPNDTAEGRAENRRVEFVKLAAAS